MPVTPFATIPGCADDHTGITFDHFGAFGYNMIVTCQNGGVWQVDSTGSPTKIADLSTGMDLSGSTTFDSTNTNLQALIIEGPAVVPLDFGPLERQDPGSRREQRSGPRNRGRGHRYL